MEMQGRAREGLAFLAATELAWIEGTGFSAHLAWHRALFHLDSNDLKSALTTYDAQIANARAAGISVLADASAFLWRLQLRNIDVDGRWQLLADRWETRTLAGARPFYVVHAMMAFAAAGRGVAAARVFEALPPADTSDVSMSLPEEALAPPFCEALLAFAHSDYAACVEWLSRVRRIAHRCGGSLAQCDLIHLTFTEAALRARKARLPHALVAERAAKKPGNRPAAAALAIDRARVCRKDGRDASGIWENADVTAGRTEPRCAARDLKLVDGPGCVAVQRAQMHLLTAGTYSLIARSCIKLLRLA